jgi:hypothetical protein
MCGMKSPYANPYGSLTKVDVQGPSPEEQAKAKQGSANADLLRMLGSAAPVVGTALGGVTGGLLGMAGGPAGALAGASAGAGIGSQLGQLGGNALGGAADMQTRESEEKDLARRRKLDALQQVMGLI